jgi:multiple antibiotic resistance protein
MSPDAPLIALTFGKAFTFLFLTLGPLKIMGPFVAMTRGRDAAFKRKLAIEGFVIAAIAAFAAATIGVSVLSKWGVSVGALMVTAGIVLFLVALRQVLQQYEPKNPAPDAPPDHATPQRSTAIAFSPLAFPTIITPYGVAVLILLVALSGDRTMPIFAMAALVLVLDLLAMLGAERVLKTPYIASVLGIVGAVIGVLQVALGVQLVINGLRLLNAMSGTGR